MLEISKVTTYLSLFISLLLIDFFVLFRFMTTEYSFIYIGIILIAAVLMNVLSTSKNFVLVLTIILVLGFTLLSLSGTMIVTQAILIGEYLLMMGALLLMWLLFAELKRNEKEQKELIIKVKELEKYIGSTNLLTTSEFEYRVRLISTGTQRRNEKNYYIVFKSVDVNKASEALSFLLKQTLLKSIRTDFDLVTKLHDESYLVFLQNTRETGCFKVIERVFQSLRSELNLLELPINYEIFDQEKGLDYFEKNTVEGLKR